MEFGKVDSIGFWRDRVLEWNFPSYYVVHNYNRVSAEPLALKSRFVQIKSAYKPIQRNDDQENRSYSTTYG
jgi:hypothetical protein